MSKNNMRVYIPSRRMIYVVRKFISSDKYPLWWGLSKRQTLVDGGRYENHKMNRDDMKKSNVYNEAERIEPDARKYTCACCDKPKVYGAEELLLMGLYH